MMKSCGSMLGGLVSDTLEFSKITAGKVIMKAEEISVRTFFLDVAQVLRATYKAPSHASTVRLKLCFKTSIKKKMVMKVDQGRLRQIVVNLVTNAFKFTEKGAVEVTVSVVPLKQRSHKVPSYLSSGESGGRSQSDRNVTGDEARGNPNEAGTRWVCVRAACRLVGWCRQLFAADGKRLRSSLTRNTPDRNSGSRQTSTLQGRLWQQRRRLSWSWSTPSVSPDIATCTKSQSRHGGARPNSKQRQDTFTQLVISVRDTGNGIEHHQLLKLFQPFVQADATTRCRSAGGTGLGLVISRSLSQLMGGGVSCTSQVS